MTIKTFISYAREDSHFLGELCEHLNPLSEDKIIKIWSDEKINAGSNWSNETELAANQSNLFIFLWSIHSFNSEYIRNVEFPIARRRLSTGNSRIISILVREFDQSSSFTRMLQHWQMLPRDGRAIEKRRFRNEAWREVAKSVRDVVNDISSDHPCEDITIGSRNTAFSEIREETSNADHDSMSIHDAWSEIMTGRTLPKYLSVYGTFSQFAPLLVGPPFAKKQMHKEFRQALDEGRTPKSSSIDACLSISSGQMVTRYSAGNGEFQVCGIYESIVRNTFPVFVNKNYLEKEIFSGPLAKRKTLEVEITGPLVRVSSKYITDFLEKYKLNEMFSHETIAYFSNCSYGILVDGVDGKISISSTKPRYLDGDIWLVLSEAGQEAFETRFVNISDRDERNQSLREMITHIRALKSSNCVIIDQYDDFSELDGVVSPSFFENRSDADL